MPFNGSGTFNRIYSWVADKNAGLDISSSRMDTDTDDIAANGLSVCLTRDGQGSATANLPMNTFRHTSVGNAVNRTDYAAAGQIQDGGLLYNSSAGSSNAYTLSLSPAITVYSAGQTFLFKANFTNTGASTLNVNGLGAKNIYKQSAAGPIALTEGEIKSGQVAGVTYDGTEFQLTTAPAPVSFIQSGTAVTAPNDTSEDTLATIAIPANSIGANGKVIVSLNFQTTNDANAKTIRVKFGGTTIASNNFASVSGGLIQVWIANANATGTQSNSSWVIVTTGAGYAAATSSSIDTTAAQNIVVTCQKANGADTVVMVDYSVEIRSIGS